MPTIEEIRAQAATEGVTDQTEINRRIAEAQKAGTLTAKPLVEYKPFAEMEEVPEIGLGAKLVRDIGGVYTRYQRTKDPIEMIKKGLAEKRRQAGEFFHEVETGTAAPSKVAAAEAEKKAAEEAAPTEGAFGPEIPPGAKPTAGRGIGLPKTQIPELADLERRLGGIETAYKKAGKRFEKAGMEKRAAIGEWAKTEKERLRAEADVFGEAAAVSRDLEAQRIEKEEQRQAYVNQELGKVRESIDQMMASKIDPYRFYKHPDGSANYPKSVAAAVAIGLGALGANLPARYGGGVGGPNVALQIIDKAIDRDIQAQRDDIANQRAGVGMQMNLLSQMRAKFGDERQAENAARVIMLETYKMKLQESAARSGVAQVEAKAQMMIAEADERQAMLLSDMDVKASSEMFRGEQVMLGAEMKKANMIFQQEAAAIKAMMKKAGKQLPASAVAKMADFRGANKIVSHVKRAWNESMKGNWAAGLSQYAPWATDAKSFDDMILMAAQIVGKKFEGRMTDEDFKRFERMMPSPGDSTKRAMKKLNTMMLFLNTMESETLRTYQETGFDVSGFEASAGQGKPTAGFSEL